MACEEKSPVLSMSPSSKSRLLLSVPRRLAPYLKRLNSCLFWCPLSYGCRWMLDLLGVESESSHSLALATVDSHSLHHDFWFSSSFTVNVAKDPVGQQQSSVDWAPWRPTDRKMQTCRMQLTCGTGSELHLGSCCTCFSPRVLSAGWEHNFPVQKVHLHDAVVN